MTWKPVRHRYRGWDGRLDYAPIRPEALLDQLGMRFLEQDAAQVMNDILHRGLASDNGESLPGLDELRGAIRERLRDVEPGNLDPSITASEGDLSDDASSLLREMLSDPTQAGRLLAGASPGIRDELLELRGAGGPLQNADPLAAFLDLADLDGGLRQTRHVADVGDVPLERIAAVLGEDLAARFGSLTTTLTTFNDQGYLDTSGSGLSPQAWRRLGRGLLQEALSEIESRLGGDHQAQHIGAGQERADSTRGYQFGDPFDLDLAGTVLQAVRRSPGAPVQLQPGDMTIFEREETGRVAMVLAIDRSRSMGERGYLLAAKRLALSLTALVHTHYPRDRLDLLTFSNEAEPTTPLDLASLQWERYAVGTNIHDALVAGRRKLAGASGLRRTLVLITDGEPTAYRDRSGEVRYSEPPGPEALAATYAAARQLRRDQILLVLALLTQERQTVTFAEEVVRHSGGRLMAAEPDDLNVAVLMGYRSLRRMN